MAHRIRVEKSVLRTLRRLQAADRRRVARRIDSLALQPRPAGVKKLSAPENIYRVRAGDYRILYQMRDRELLVLVVGLGHRREVYRKR